jgi:hypothetical protein
VQSDSGQAHRAGQAEVGVTGGGVSTRVVVYENEGIRGVNEGGFENFARMRKSLVDSTLRKFLKLDEPKTGIKQDDCEELRDQRSASRDRKPYKRFQGCRNALG